MPPATDETRIETMVDQRPALVLGTFGYMAPEQVRGVGVDHRADMFAFGGVLYEMLGGARAFKGETAADTMTAVLTKEPPDLDTARLAISPGLDRIVRRCLEKSPELRFQSANDLAFALETLSSAIQLDVDRSSPPLFQRQPARTAWLPWAVAAAALLAAAASWFGPSARTGYRARDGARSPASPKPAGEETSPALSPDGGTVAYSMRVERQLGHLLSARRRAQRDADRQRSAAQRTRRGVSRPTDR